MRELILAVMCLMAVSTVQAASHEKQAASMDQVISCDQDVGVAFMIENERTCTITLGTEGLAMKATTSGPPVWKDASLVPLLEQGTLSEQQPLRCWRSCKASSCRGMPGI